MGRSFGIGYTRLGQLLDRRRVRIFRQVDILFRSCAYSQHLHTNYLRMIISKLGWKKTRLKQVKIQSKKDNERLKPKAMKLRLEEAMKRGELEHDALK